MQWYYVKDGERLGPTEEQELRDMLASGALDDTDLVWNETMGQEWVSAKDALGGDKAPESGSEHAPATVSEILEQRQKNLKNPKAPKARMTRGQIGIIAPIGVAWQRMVYILFKPFDIGKWFGIGFTAWLATLGEDTGGSSGNWGNIGDSNEMAKSADWNSIRDQVTTFWQENGTTVIAVALGIIAVMVIFSLLVMWLQSRGKFMFLDNVAHNRGLVKQPWAEYKSAGNSLFGWMIVYSIISTIIMLAILAAGWVTIGAPCVAAGTFVKATIPAIIGLGTVLFIYVFVVGIIGKFLEDFVIPTMYATGLGAVKAWGRWMELMRGTTGRVILYLLMCWLLELVAASALGLLVIVTCCIAGCILAIPVIGTVLILPILVFFRAYSVTFLAQFADDVVVFPEDK